MKCILELTRKKYGLELNLAEIDANLKNLFCTDAYFLFNPIVVCTYAVLLASANHILRDNFFKIFEEANLDKNELKAKISLLDSYVKNNPFPAQEECEKAVKRFEEIMKISSLMRRPPPSAPQ